VEVIPGKLTVRVFLHDIVTEGETIPCWSYVTEGLMAQKQKEIIFTLQRNKNQKADDYPHDFFDLFKAIYHLAEAGKLVRVGGITAFGPKGFMGQKDFAGIGYVEPETLPGVDAPGPRLAAILLKGDEPEIVWFFGMTRVVALLGMKYRHYPYPVWSDLKRDAVASIKSMKKNLMAQVPRTSADASYYEERNHIFLSVQPGSREVLQQSLSHLPPGSPLVIDTWIDSRAVACLVWSRKDNAPTTAITPPDSKGARKTGSFLAFVPEQQTNEIKLVEDGYSLFVTTSSWQKIREALASGSNVSIPGPDGAILTIEWSSDPGLHN
jgi:hypothetical protein